MYSEYSDDSELQLIETLKQMAAKNVFTNYIKKITFPFYKNLETNSSITFDFPLTAIVGSNGTGKSSVLRALQGAPRGKSLGNYWFSTSMDPIIETGEKGKRNSFFYEYLNEKKELKEVLKQRMQRSGDPDYWETSRPVLAYGMKPLPKGERNSAVEKNVTYLDFRTELSAFDKYFHLGLIDVEKTLKEKKRYIRNQTKILKNVIVNNTVVTIKTKNQNEKVIDLTKEELECISFILGRNYISGKIIKHKFFKDWGTSVVLDKNKFSYTEAMAGSGEIAVVKIVHELFQAKDGDLILLDEPEVSIHPGAQAKIKYVLLNLIKQKKLQVVISTHSTTLIEKLPTNAIKKFEVEPISEMIIIKNECYMHEAFYTLGQKIMNSRYTIQTEDALSTEMVKRILEDYDPNLVSQFNICYNPGGASTIKSKFIPIYSQSDTVNTFIILDGDQRPNSAIIELESLPARDISCEKLDELISTMTKCKVEFNTDGNSQDGGRSDQRLDLQKKYYNYFKDNVFFLPKLTPEELIWDINIISNLISYNQSSLDELNNLKSAKEKIHRASQLIFKTSSDNAALEKLLLTKWLENDSSEKRQILDIIVKIVEHANNNYFSTV